MALTKSPSARAVQASATNTAGSTTTTSGQSIGYGVTGVAVITNGATGPTVACGVYVDFSADNSTWITGDLIGQGTTANSDVTRLRYTFGIGAGGDFGYYRLRFTGNTGQSVTVQADDSTTSGL